MTRRTTSARARKIPKRVTLTVGLPEHVQPRRSRYEDAPDTHSVEIVEPRDKTPEITTESKLGLPPIPLEHCTKVVVVRRVTIGPLVEQDGVEGDFAPIVGRRVVGRTLVGGILGGVLGILVRVNVVVREVVSIR